jgi:protein ImuB
LRLILDLEVRQRRNDNSSEQYWHEWKLPVPTQDGRMLLALIRLDLERNTFSAPIRKVTVEAVPISPRMAQGNLFAPPSPEAEKLEITLARIRGVVGCVDAEGQSCVGAPAIVDTHRPLSFSVQPFSSAPSVKDSIAAASPVIAFRVFRPALGTCVELDGGTPHLVRLWKKYRHVLASSGPWHSSGNWWSRGKAWSREEWDVALKTSAGIGFYRIYRDQLLKQWFVEGIFD